MSRRRTSKRWSVNEAAGEFAIDRRTLDGRLRTGGIVAGKDKKFSTLDICRAVYGDMDGEKLRDKRLDADLKEIEKARRLRELIPAELVERAWNGCMADLAQKIGFLQIAEREKQDILADLRSIPVDDYFEDTTTAGQDDPNDGD